jgi:signal transduction histidine kinase
VRFQDKALAFADQPERGTTYWDWSLAPVKDSLGKVDGLVVSLVDTTERVRIEDELMKHRERLESLVELRTRKLTRSYDMLRKEIAERKKIEEELRGLSNRLVEMQEEERKSLARELHDEIGQSLTIVKLFLDRCHAHLQDETFRRDSVEVRAMVKKLMEQVRSLSLDLRPMMLDDLGLMSALQWHFNRFTSQSHVQVNFKQSGLEKKRIPPEVGTAAYRIVQEALTNVARYANVAEAMVSIEAKKGLLRIEVEDHGAGFDMERAAEGPGAGLSGIRERVIALNGTLTIESAEGAGTYVLAELPLPDGAGRKASEAAK